MANLFDIFLLHRVNAAGESVTSVCRTVCAVVREAGKHGKQEMNTCG